VPYGPTTEGFGGTYATQANFKLMRAALDETSREVKRYIRLPKYCSGPVPYPHLTLQTIPPVEH